MNKCYFTTRTTRDLEIRYTANQTAVAKGSIAVDTGYGDNKQTSFFNITAWGKVAESMEKHVKKGTKLVLECEARQNSYTDKNGNKVNAVEFVVLNWEFAESKQSQQSAPQKPKQEEWMSIPDGISEELPFM